VNLGLYILVACARTTVIAATAYGVTRSFQLQYIFAVSFVRLCARIAQLLCR
jgi:hypothetical protein